MKQLILLFAFLTSFSMQSFGQIQQSADSDTLNGTTVVSTIDDPDDYWTEEKQLSKGGEFIFNQMENMLRATLIIPILGIIMIFGLPILIVALVLYFRHKNKQAKYKLAAEALAAGKEVPKELFEENLASPKHNNETLTKGIQNICLGLGLGVFLWLLTNVAAIAAIGFIIFCKGVGEVIIAYATRSSEKEPSTTPKGHMTPDELKKAFNDRESKDTNRLEEQE
jgi:hypothetical protein